MKHNKITKKILSTLDKLEDEASQYISRKESKEFRETLKDSPKVAKSKNWNLVKEEEND